MLTTIPFETTTHVNDPATDGDVGELTLRRYANGAERYAVKVGCVVTLYPATEAGEAAAERHAMTGEPAA